jgi:hypothetical protein
MRSVRIATWTSGEPVSPLPGVVLDDFGFAFSSNRHVFPSTSVFKVEAPNHRYGAI